MRPTLLLLSEDSSKDAIPTVAALVRRMLRQICPSYQESRVLLQPLANRQAQQAVHGNRWKSRSSQDREERLSLMREVSTLLLQDERSFVLFHVDGDRAWAERSISENLAKFEEFRQAIGACMQTTRRDPALLRRALDQRLLLLMPFYSIEAWLFQNAREAISICEEQRAVEDARRFRGWEAARGELDEVLRPKEEVGIGGRHNRRLAERGFPLQDVLAVGKSLAQAQATLSACASLREALESTAGW